MNADMRIPPGLESARLAPPTFHGPTRFRAANEREAM